MTAARKDLSQDTLLRMLSGLWPKYHAAREQEYMAWCMNDTADARSWRKVREENQRKINRVCGCLDIHPVECPTCGTIMRNTDRELLREEGKILPFDAETPTLEKFVQGMHNVSCPRCTSLSFKKKDGPYADCFRNKCQLWKCSACGYEEEKFVEKVEK